jgi:demethylmenaquinone methyltransferase/2-methoxy-6-polyprenyl-1,4-benzoquinol methylase
MNYKVESVNPYDSERPKKEQVTQMFDLLAPTYDKLNGILSLGIDEYWRREALSVLKKYPHSHILDIATGTGDFAILANKILQPDKITAVDISDGMMAVGKEKVKTKGFENIISFENLDCANMTFPDNNFDAAISAFGVRNFEDIDKSFSEVLRVLKPGGVFMFIELTTPEKPPMKELYQFYTKKIMPLLSGIFATEQRAYEYLPNSIGAFPQGRKMMLILKKNDFRNIRLRRLTQEITTIYIAEK